MAEVEFDGSQVTDWASFHLHAKAVFGFPSFYGNNMNAFIDCLTYLAEADGMSRFVLQGDERLHIHLTEFASFSTQQPEICAAFLECIAFTNQRSLQAGESPRLLVIPQ